MKKFTIVIALILGFSFQYATAQDKNTKADLLNSYFEIKDALVESNADSASFQAANFIAVLNNLNAEDVAKEEKESLLKSAGQISASKEIKDQREYFSEFSKAMIKLAKSKDFGTDKIYHQYCPMKKADWLSKTSDIKNPYYGKAMLTCGKVTETIE